METAHHPQLPGISQTHDTNARLIHTWEALHILRDFPSGTVDAIITDPPYCSGGVHRADKAQSTLKKYVHTGFVVKTGRASEVIDGASAAGTTGLLFGYRNAYASPNPAPTA